MTRFACFVAFLGFVVGNATARAQFPGNDAPNGRKPTLELPSLKLPTDLGGVSGFKKEDVGTIDFDARFQVLRGSTQGVLMIRATPTPGWHFYSVTQLDGGPKASTLKLLENASVQLTGEFRPDRPPEIHRYDFYRVPVEEHPTTTEWSAPFRLAEGVDPASLVIQVRYDGQVCKGTCIPISNRVLEARFAGYIEASGEYRADGSDIAIRGRIEPGAASPGGEVRLVLTAVPNAGWHIYPRADADSQRVGQAKPTVIVLADKGGLQAGAPVASAPPITKSNKGVSIQYHQGEVSWTIPLTVPKSASPGERTISGYIGYQICQEDVCQRPLAANFRVTVPVGGAAAASLPLAFASAKYDDAAKHPALASWVDDARQPLDRGRLLKAIGFGLLGGLILNLMPCVLPVIGLKILSFAEQAGESRARVLALNVWFTLGLMLVFMVLATLAAFLNLGWGEQFTLTWFKVAMTGLVFAMALSFLGVWELPIPGFAGTGVSSELQTREGLFGAFFKGVFTTILATPCSGPFLGPVFALTLNQPWQVTYVLFGSVGLGMASPYLLVGLFPQLVHFLPKPGDWMDTFKQLLAFVLLGTVVYLFTTIKSDYFVATLTLLFGLWFGCWCIGRVPTWESSGRRFRAWGTALAVSGAVGYLGFAYLAPHPKILPWQPFTPERLAQLRNEGQTVMVDFTAEWCLTCKLNFNRAIDTRRIEKVVQRNSVAPLLADWTDQNDTIRDTLNGLGSKSIPLLAIYPPDASRPVIVLRDVVTENQVMAALEQAGPSRNAARPRGTTTASTR